MNFPQEMTVLLVEDDPADVELELKVFEKFGLNGKVAVARDGVEALDYIFGGISGSDQPLTHLPKIVFLDLKIPYMDGFEILRQLKFDPRTKCIPVVVLSSSSETKDIERCYRLCANSYVVKPIDADQFEAVISLMVQYWLAVNLYPPFKIPSVVNRHLGVVNS